MNLSQLNYFVCIAQMENYSRAAEQLHVSQSSLSYAIATLEQELGVKLFYKAGRNIRLTESGQQFLGYVRRGLQELETGRQAMQSRRDPLLGTVRLAFVSSMSPQFIPTLIRDFRMEPRHTGVNFRLRECNTTDALTALLHRTADLGFGTNTGEQRVEYYPVHTERLVAVVPKDHPWSVRESLPIGLLDREPYIAYAPDCGTRSFVEAMLQRAQVSPQTVFEAPTDLMVAGMVASGLGVGICPDLPELQSFAVKTLAIEGVNSDIRQVFLFWRADHEMLPAVKHFRDFIIAARGSCESRS